MPKAAAAAAPVAAVGLVDPLSELSLLSLFPRTIGASADAPRDLDSIHNFMKFLKELRSPEKLVSEAKKIVDGGADHLSNFSSFAGNVNAANNAAKVKDMVRGRRPGLGITYKKAQFSLKNNISNPPSNLEPTLDVANLQDPDAYFDACERLENAKKEILRQQGCSTEVIVPFHLYDPSDYVRERRPGLSGRSFRSEHRRYTFTDENDDMWMSSQETMHQDTPPKDDLHKNLVDQDPNHDANMEEVELAESKKTESQVSNLLEELLSCNDEDLEGEGALNILQERLKIKPLDLDNLCCSTELPDVGRSNALTSSVSRQKIRKSSLVFDSVLKSLNKKPRIEQENGENPVIPVSSPTPPRSPFGSISLLRKKVLQPNPLNDPFLSDDIDLCAVVNSSPANPKDKLPGQVAAPKDLGICNELESHVEFGNTKDALSDVDSQKVIENVVSLPELSQNENASMERESGTSKANASASQPQDALVGQVNALKNAGMFSNMESNVEFYTTVPSPCNLDEQEVTGNADGLPEHFDVENANILSMDACSRQTEELNSTIGKRINTNENESNPSVVEDDARDDASIRQHIPEQQPKVPAAKRKIGKKLSRVERIRAAHPMRKSLAGAGTSFDTGMRRSTRVKTRPLEYWKGERYVYGRVDDSFKLLGLKYISPGKGNDNLKVKPYISLEKPGIKELLDLAARH